MSRRRGRPRLWRAIAFVPDPVAPNGRRREVAGRVSACTQDGLTRWVNEQRAKGNAVDVYRVGTIEDVLA